MVAPPSAFWRGLENDFLQTGSVKGPESYEALVDDLMALNCLNDPLSRFGMLRWYVSASSESGAAPKSCMPHLRRHRVHGGGGAAARSMPEE